MRHFLTHSLLQVVVKGDLTYLREYNQLVGPISPAVLEDIVIRAKQQGSLVPGSSVEANINRLVNSCRDVEVVHRICQETELRVTSEGEDRAYAKDLQLSLVK